MPKLVVERTFRHCVGTDVHPTEFLASQEPVEVDDRTLEVAEANGWGTEYGKAKKPSGAQSRASGQAKK